MDGSYDIRVKLPMLVLKYFRNSPALWSRPKGNPRFNEFKMSLSIFYYLINSEKHTSIISDYCYADLIMRLKAVYGTCFPSRTKTNPSTPQLRLGMTPSSESWPYFDL